MQYTFKNSSGHGDDLLRDFLKYESLYNYLRALTNQFCGKDLKLLNFTPENCAVDDETGRHWIVKNGALDIDAMQYISLFENRRICLYCPYISTRGNGLRGELFFDIKENCYEPFPLIQKGKMKKESHNSDPNPFPYCNVKTGWYKKYDIKLVGDEKGARILIQDILRYNNLCDYVQAIAFPESLQGDLHGTKATSPYFVYIAHERPKKIFLIKKGEDSSSYLNNISAILKNRYKSDKYALTGDKISLIGGISEYNANPKSVKTALVIFIRDTYERKPK